MSVFFYLFSGIGEIENRSLIFLFFRGSYRLIFISEGHLKTLTLIYYYIRL